MKEQDVTFVWVDWHCAEFECPCGENVVISVGYVEECDCGRKYALTQTTTVWETEEGDDG